MTQREKTDMEMEMLIHRLVFNKVASYDQLFACLESHQCLGLRQAKLEFDKVETQLAEMPRPLENAKKG